MCKMAGNKLYFRGDPDRYSVKKEDIYFHSTDLMLQPRKNPSNFPQTLLFSIFCACYPKTDSMARK